MVYRLLSYSGVSFPINSAPIAALFLCAVLYMGWKGMAIASMIWLSSYPFLSLLQGYSVSVGFLASFSGLSIIAMLGFSLRIQFLIF